MFSRKRPILHVSFSTEWDSDDSDFGPAESSHVHRSVQQTAPLSTNASASPLYTVPDASLLERESLSSSSESGTNPQSVRSLVKAAAKHAWRCTSSSLDDRFLQMSLSCETKNDCDTSALARRVAQLEISTKSQRRTHRKVYTGSSKTDQKSKNNRISKTLETPACADFPCPRCGHMFTLRKSLGMHLKVCEAESSADFG